MTRETQALHIASRMYDAIGDILANEKVDAGVGIAVCQLLSGWLKASSEAQITLTTSRLAEVPYFRRKNEQDHGSA